MRKHILLLNADHSFLTTVDLKKSISLWARGKVKILKSKNKMIHYGFDLYEPEVIVLKDFLYLPYSVREVKLSRENVMLRDDCVCQYSGRKLKKSEIEIDHIVPRSRGGKNTWDNLVVSSKDINNMKGDRTPEEAGLKLIRKPFKPTMNKIFPCLIKKEWEEFLK